MNVMSGRAGIWIPKPAAAVGYLTPIYFQGFDTINPVDVGLTNTGKDFYINNAHFWSGAHWGTIVDPNPAWFTVAGGVLTQSDNNDAGGSIAAQSFKYTNPGYTTQVPLIDGSLGFYAELRAQFLPPVSPHDFLPDFWMQDITQTIHETEQAGTGRAAEVDIIEGTSGGSYKVFQTYVEWQDWQTGLGYVRSNGLPGSTLGSGLVNGDFSGLDFSVYHTWGARVRTMAQNGGTGTLAWFCDGAQTGQALTWTNTGQFGGAIESAMFQFNFGGCPGQNFNIDYIGVWKP